MMRIGSAFVFSVAPLAWSPAVRQGQEAHAASITQKDGADGLKALFETAHAACTSKDFAKGQGGHRDR